jgi:hypothetical protein
VSGLDHPDTLTVRLNLAAWTERAGDAAGARDQLAELVLVEERVLGAEHPGTLLVRAGLAAWTGLAGMRRGAGPVRGAPARHRADVRRGAHRNPGRPRQPRLLDPADRGEATVFGRGNRR